MTISVTCDPFTAEMRYKTLAKLHPNRRQDGPAANFWTRYAEYQVNITDLLAALGPEVVTVSTLLWQRQDLTDVICHVLV